MKNKILATIQDSQKNIDSYLNYVSQLSNDFKLGLDIIPAERTIENDAEPIAITGQGIPVPTTLKARTEKKINYRNNILNNTVNERFDESAFDIISNVASQQDFILWTINQASNDSFFNKLLGTTETELSKRTVLPSLTIPEGCVYKKPETILIVVRDTPNLELTHLQTLSKHMNLKIAFAYHEDEEEITIKNIMASMQVSFGQFIGSFKTFSVKNNNDLFDKILNYEKPEWIAYANYDRSPLERLYKINTNELILSTELPVLNF